MKIHFEKKRIQCHLITIKCLFKRDMQLVAFRAN